MNTLVVNAGSTSLKVDVFAMPEEACRFSARVQRIGKADAEVEIEVAGRRRAEETTPIADHGVALSRVLDVAVEALEIDAAGHRVVHGGEDLCEPTCIDASVEATIERCARFAPLHNLHNLAAIRACRRRLPEIRHVAVMDTGFHRTLRPEAFVYGLPYELYERQGVRRYGFHGTSHEYVANEAARLIDRELGDLCLITCHLGGGASVCAVAGGASVDTSMGMTPLEGLLMGTRSGDLDPGVLLFLQDQLGLSASAVDDLLNRQSGLKGVSGVSRDMRELTTAAAAGHRRARLAIDVFCRRVRGYIGAYAAQLGAVDAVVFTGGIGENAADIRKRICSGLEVLGLSIDDAANRRQSTAARSISPAGSAPAALVVPTDEELQIAREVHGCIGDDA